MQPRYPQIHVGTRSRNPLTLVAVIREELRLLQAGEDEIRRFSREALAAGDARAMRAVCSHWAVVRERAS